MEWPEFIDTCVSRYGARTRAPLPEAEVRDRLLELSIDLPQLTALYVVTNGLSLDWFVVFPLLDRRDTKHTWEDLSRVNRPGTTRYLGGDAGLLERFLVFSTIGAGAAGVLDRTDGSIWYEEDGELHQTTWSLGEFIENALREVGEL